MQMVQPSLDVPDPGFVPHEDPESVHHKQWIIAKANAMPFPPTPLDDLIDRLGGPGAVAEMTYG